MEVKTHRETVMSVARFEAGARANERFENTRARRRGQRTADPGVAQSILLPLLSNPGKVICWG